MDVSIIIVNYNTSEHLSNCLKSILNLTNHIEFEIIVVDNNSRQRDIEDLALKYSKVNFLFRNVNDGFGAGCNYGAKYAIGEYLCFINPDIILLENTLYEFFKFMNQNHNVVACSCLQKDNEDNLINSFDYFPGLVSTLRESFYIGYKKHLHSLLSKKEILENIPFEVDYHIAAVLFVRKSVFNYIEGFDQSFFLYSEDIDICYRLKKHGSILCLPSEMVYHYFKSTARDDKGKFMRIFHISRSKMIYLYKHFNFFQRNVIRMIMFFGIILRLFYLPFNKIHSAQRKDVLKVNILTLRNLFSKFNPTILV